jgi:peptidoglycan/xylan/chitin deacetylase (PgdA/CDA1 family)
MGEAGERSMIEEVTARIAGEEGRPPRGWLSPWLSQTWATPDVLEEAGYRYLLDWGHDDQPVWLATRSGGRILSIPYPRPTNDLPLMHGARVVPSVWADILIDQFDEMLEQSRRQPLVFNLSLHPYLVGQAFRLRQLRRLITHIAGARSRIWLTHPGAIAEHAAALPPGIVP